MVYELSPGHNTTYINAYAFSDCNQETYGAVAGGPSVAIIYSQGYLFIRVLSILQFELTVILILDILALIYCKYKPAVIRREANEQDAATQPETDN